MNKAMDASRAQESRAAIDRMYIAMRHLFVTGGYRPMDGSGDAIIEALMMLRPEIYGSIADPERVELDGLLYIFQRLPIGIEECRYIKLISREGFQSTHFKPLVPEKRRRNCYRVDAEQMFIEVTRGRSDIYDILTHLTFMYVEADKILANSVEDQGMTGRNWQMLETIVNKENLSEEFNQEVAITYLSTILGRTYAEVEEAVKRFEAAKDVSSLFHITYWLGRWSMEERNDGKFREITFSSALREKIGHHEFGEEWARRIKGYLFEEGLIERPLHIISSNLHSVMNSVFGLAALERAGTWTNVESLALDLSLEKNESLRKKVKAFGLRNGMHQIDETSATNIAVQILDFGKIDPDILPDELGADAHFIKMHKPVIIVMDYAFGEQAYETMDELLKIFDYGGQKYPLQVESISVMGKAGILEGDKGDIMLPHSHVFEGTAHNYPFENALKASDFEGYDIHVAEGSMITVLGTSLQNRDILMYFLESSWKSVGLEMEGAHYQKAIQAASRIRNSIRSDVALRYAYYASDNPLISGLTLASGGLGVDGVKPTYLITLKILGQILNPDKR